MNYRTAGAVARRPAAEVEQRFMSAVYRWMTVGLFLTATVAYGVASSRTLLEIIVGNRMVFWGLILGEFGLVFALSASVHRLSAAAAGAMFLLYSALNGATLSILLLIYTGNSVAAALAVTAGTFATMSLYATVTKKDLSSWGSFLFMGLVGVVIAGLVNMFLQSGMMSFIISCASVVVFTGLTAYDTQKLRQVAAAGGGSGALAVSGALMLYLDFINLFLALLRLFGSRRD
ncbi:MAG: Bax inhibitor-1/YccA family protein [Myxococcales bacterium]|nr:Bax inhibitor-1/YccA family protein [Myxococcales bacterium]